MNKLIPFSKITKSKNGFSGLSDSKVAVDKKGVPVGFVFGRDAFISFLEYIDSEFEKKVKDPKKAFDNPAGKLIDLIEEKLPLNPVFVQELKSSIEEAQKTEWISLEQIKSALHV